MNLFAAPLVAAALVVAAAQPIGAASELTGRVVHNGLAVPGASVTATKGDRTVATHTDEEGVFRFETLEDGAWLVRVDMRGFVPLDRDITLPLTAAPPPWALTMQPYAEIVAGIASPAASAAATAAAGAAASDTSIINGSVVNGAATPFAQPRGFGNNRPQLRQTYNGAINGVFGNSDWNARPYSFGDVSTPAPDYNNMNVGFQLSGPLRIPWLIASGPQMSAGYQRNLSHNAVTQSAVMPSEAARRGDFSQLATAVRDPRTGQPFSGNIIPVERISPQAAALLAYYPFPNGLTSSGSNFQAPVLTGTTEDRAQLSMQETFGRRDTLSGSFNFQRATTDSSSIFAFNDRTLRSSLDTTVGFSRRVTTKFQVRFRYQYQRTATTVTPFFYNTVNVSGDAGINGNNQDPENWGPPLLSFPDVADLRDAAYHRNVSQSHLTGVEASLSRGRHNITVGGDTKWIDVAVRAQQDARGGFGFTGEQTGLAFADFLLDMPATATLAFGNADKDLRGMAYDAYVNDDFRVNAGLTLNFGARWEYESPFTEAQGRLVNLDIVDGFTAASPVLASDPTGPLTGTTYPASLLRPDRTGLQPRLGVSWRPILGSSLVIRANYGIYRNTEVYQPLALLLAQQPPLSNTFSVQSTAEAPLTLANGFTQAQSAASNTYAIDPDFRVGVAHNWQASVQRELPANLTVLAQYLGTRGTHLTQASLPNTNPAGAADPCPTCPFGFIYLSSDGSSLRHALQLMLRRRLRNGFTASVQYTFSRASDDAATFLSGAVSSSSLAVAQDWRDLGAERGPSSFDQPHLTTIEFQYTTGVGVTGGTLTTGAWASLYKDWTFTSQLRAGSGLPSTPIYFAPVTGTGVVGVRPRLTGVSTAPPSSDAYANPDAYAAPEPGYWGDAGRNSLRGPRQFSLDASVSRVFRLGGRVNLEWGFQATNILNRVTFAAFNAVITSPQFGLPTIANQMRRLQTSFRFRF